ncbi:MAG: endopeptidase La [Clostridium sp.]
MENKLTLPLLPLRGITVFPDMVIHFDVGRNKSIEAIKEAMDADGYIFLASQKDGNVDDPTKEDIYEVGTICEIKQMLKLPDSEGIKVLVKGLERAEIINYLETEEKFVVEINRKENDYIDENNKVAYVSEIKSLFQMYIKVAREEKNKQAISALEEEDIFALINIIAPIVAVEDEQMQGLLEKGIEDRAELLLTVMSKEISIMTLQKDIAQKVNKEIDENQKQYYLREQIKVLQQELGEGEEEELLEFEERITDSLCDDDIKIKMNKELQRLKGLSYSSSEGNSIRNYLNWILDMPWGILKDERSSLGEVEKCLDINHYGMNDVKERILEYLTVRKYSKNLKSNILCLVGPPGVGKTSIGKSIAEALNRDFQRVSLGGMKDESEIRGHRRTYVGATPGRFIHALKDSKSLNPVILLDEIDKISTSYKGEPADALLEVLDNEQNKTFRDNYLEIPINLSEVLFVVTANSLHTIPAPLIDRMDIIQLSGYSYDEKYNIAKNHIIPRIYEEFNLDSNMIKISDNTIMEIIDGYTKESGVRDLERKLKELCRKTLRIIEKEKRNSYALNSKQLEKILGKKLFDYSCNDLENKVGVVTGLAWTSYGGDTLPVEAIAMKGNGKLQLTGKLGEVMQESAKAAYTYVRANCDNFSIDEEFYKKQDIHIHVPEGAIPKDGPSAGVTMVTAIVSSLSGKHIKGNIAMTGEVTITGRVLAIGGLKEKALAAFRAGIDTILIPKDNEKDIKDIPKSIRKKMSIITVNHVDQVIENAIVESV